MQLSHVGRWSSVFNISLAWNKGCSWVWRLSKLASSLSAAVRCIEEQWLVLPVCLILLCLQGLSSRYLCVNFCSSLLFLLLLLDPFLSLSWGFHDFYSVSFFLEHFRVNWGEVKVLICDSSEVSKGCQVYNLAKFKYYDSSSACYAPWLDNPLQDVLLGAIVLSISYQFTLYLHKDRNLD